MKDIKQFWLTAKKSAQKLHGIVAGTIWFDNDDPDEVDALTTMAIKKAGFKRSDFFKPVRVDHLVVDDMPLEGIFDTVFCDRYKLAEDGKSWLMPAAQIQSADSNTTGGVSHADVSTSNTTDAGDTLTQADLNPGSAGVKQDANNDISTKEQGNGPEGLGYNVNGEPMAEVMKKMDWPVVEMSLPMRWMAQMGKSTKTLHLNPEEYGRVMGMTAPQDDDVAALQNNINLMLVGELAPDLDKLDLYHLHRLTMAVEKVAATGERMGLHLLCRFVRAWLDTEYIDQGILVKSWCEGKRISRVEKMQQTTAGDTSDLQNAKDGEIGASTRPRRSEKPTHRTINYEIGCGFYDDLDFDNLRPAMDFAKRIIAEDREDWKRMSITVGIIPDIKEFDRQTIIDLVRKAPKAVLTGSPELRRAWCESFLAVHGVRDSDWYEYVPNKAATTHEENLETVRKAGKCLRDIEAGRFQHEEGTQPTDTLADEPAATETVEPDTTKHHQDSQQVETESSVAVAVAVAGDGDQSQREHVSKQLAAERGDFVPGISDPNDPKWLTESYTNKNKETEKVDSVTKITDGVYDVAVFFATETNSVKESEAQESNTEINNIVNDDRSPVRDEIVICLLRAILAELKELNANQATTAARNNRLVSAMIDEALNVILSDDGNKKVMEHE